MEEGEIERNPMERMSPPRLDLTPVPVVPQEDLRKLLRACSGKAFENLRDTALVRLFISTGARLSEVADILIDDVDLHQEMILVRGKAVVDDTCPSPTKR